MTHKGEEIIEDIEGFDIGKQFREEELLEREREREKASREKTKAVSISPVSPVRQSFGPQDILAQQHTAASQMAAHALAVQTANLAQAHTKVDTPTEPSFRLDDLIAIDLPDSPNQGPTELPVTDEVPSVEEKVHKESSADAQTEQQETMSPTAAFDLKNVWSGNESTPQESSGSPIVSARPDEGNDLPNVDIDLGTTATHDEDFDMFLAETEPPPPATATAPVLSGPEREQAAFESIPIIWNGNILMPDSEQCPKVQARQVGGRPIDSHSSQWSILFPTTPSHQLRIEGRVPVNDSAKYITQNRLNVSRELVVVAFTPADELRKEYDELLSILISRGRHAVIHPWGSRPSPDAPGKELYLVPIVPKQPLPDYVELLDLTQFPKQSDENRLLGVFILNKGKFPAPAAAYTQPVPPLPPSGLPLPHTVPSLLTNLTSTLPPPIPSIPSVLPNVNQNQPLNPDLVSKLSAEQIESLLQSVLANNNGSLPTSLPMSTPAIPTTTPFVPLPTSIANLLQSHQAIVHPSPPYPYSPTQHQGPPPNTHPNSFNFGPRGDPTSERDRSAPPYERRNDRNERGRGRGRGFEKTRDGGWAGRARGRGRGNNNGGGGPNAWL